MYLVPMKVVLPETGEIVGAFVPASPHEARVVRERKYRRGQVIRAILQRPRNAKFHRLAHAIGALAVDHIEGFEGMETHDALKRLQRESGVCCEESEIEIPALGKVLLKTPQSIAFDEMEEADFKKLVLGVCAYIREKFHGVPPSELSEIIAAVEEGS